MKTEFTPTTLGMLRSFAIFRASFKKLSKPFSTPDFCMTASLHTTVEQPSRLTMPVLMGKYSLMAIFCSSSRSKPM